MSNRIITRSFTLRIYISVILTLVLLIEASTLSHGILTRRSLKGYNKSPSVTGPSRPINNEETPPTANHTRTQVLVPLGKIIEHNETSITFVASMKSPEQTRMTDWRTDWRRRRYNHVAQLSPEFQYETQTLRQGSEMPKRILPSKGFVQSVVAAYKDHHNLLLTPDDIWIAILFQFSLYVNANAEELRHHFVSHNGTKQLDIFVHSNWTEAFKDLESILKSNTNPKMSQFVTNNFTTTTEATRIVSTLVFMSTLQKYFTYNFAIMCGIPRITILGTVGDWEEIAKRVEFLKTFGPIPTQWSEMLSPIIEQFIKAKKGVVDADFWGNMVKVEEKTGCGNTGAFLDGWIKTFALFDRKGKGNGIRGKEGVQKWPRVDTNTVASGVVSVPITINGVQNGTILVGHMGHEVSNDLTTLSPYAGWAVTVESYIDKVDSVSDVTVSPEYEYLYDNEELNETENDNYY